jgi:magnesium transporter
MTISTLPDLATAVCDVARTDFVSLSGGESIGEALARLRGQHIGERVVYFYVTDPENRLEGVVPTRRLLLAAPETLVRDVMVQPVISVRTSDSFGTALETLTERKLLAVPVVDDAGRLAGVVDVSTFTQTMIDLERRESAEELFQLAGVHMQQQRSRGAGAVLRTRFPWLLCNIASGLAAAWLSGHFGALLESVVALAFFVPLLLTISESVAMQSLALSLNRLAVAGALPRRAGALEEVRAGLLLGLASGVAVALIGVSWLGLYGVAGVIGTSVLAAGGFGGAFGFAVPRLVRRWKLNPGVASGPVTLAITDLAALAFYFSFAAAVLG